MYVVALQKKSMLLKVALLLSMLMQVGAAIIAVSLIKRTRFNISWIIISIGFVLMALRRLIDFFNIFEEARKFINPVLGSWIAVLISVLMFVGVIFIKRIFNLQFRIDQLRKESEKRVLSAIIRTEEKAKQSIARDLHDGMGPILSSIKMSISAVSREQLDPQNKLIIENAGRAIDEGILSLKEISNDLSPHILKNYGLLIAVETFAEQLLSNSDIGFSIDSNLDNKRYNSNLEICAYRVVCELLNNGLKHSAAKNISLSLRRENEFLELIYSDDGVGFDASIYENDSKGMGLDNIRSRIRFLNGQLFIDSLPGKQTNIKIIVPEIWTN